LVITLIERKTPAGFHSLVLMELPLVLLVEKNSRIKSAEELWRRDKIDEALICLPAGETLSKDFQAQLNKLGVEWFPAIEASSTDMIEVYVAGGLGVGLSVAVPKNTLSPKVRALALPEFPPALIGALWRRKMTPLLAAFLDEAKARAHELM
jgi:DNA-binding transcriptional LysR family regulator